jgi:NADPH:quinone reductase-like Zn-dependent oxidoreductase
MSSPESRSAGVSRKQTSLCLPLSTNETLVKVRATALDPIDAKFIDLIAPPGNVAGCNFAGLVTKWSGMRPEHGELVTGSLASYKMALAEAVVHLPSTSESKQLW